MEKLNFLIKEVFLIKEEMTDIPQRTFFKLWKYNFIKFFFNLIVTYLEAALKYSFGMITIMESKGCMPRRHFSYNFISLIFVYYCKDNNCFEKNDDRTEKCKI